MFPQEVDVINIALVLPVFSSAVVKATCVWVLCVLGNSRSGKIGGWLDGGGSGVQNSCVCVVMHECMHAHWIMRGGVQCTTSVG